MLRGIYTSASGMNAELLRQDVLANNIANAGTVGFKKDDAVFEAFPNRLLKRLNDQMGQTQGFPAPAFIHNIQQEAPTVGLLGQGVKAAGTPVHFSDGSPERTDRPLDLALQGNGLFTVQRADGSVAYTRGGNFTLNSDHQLVTMAGDQVQGSGGAGITIQGKDIVVDSQGVIKVDGADVGRLAIATFDPERFQKLGENLYVQTPNALEGVGDEPQSNARVLQGYTEHSNVQVVEEMVRMIEVNRAYESNSKNIQMQDETLNKLISDVGHPLA